MMDTIVGQYSKDFEIGYEKGRTAEIWQRYGTVT